MAESVFGALVSVRGFIRGFSVVSVWFHHFSNFRVSSLVSDLVSVVVQSRFQTLVAGLCFRGGFSPPLAYAVSEVVS